jgi:hypothetical protein
MASVLKKIKVLEAKYIKEAESIAIVGQCSDGNIKTQIGKSSFDFGKRSEQEIDYEMEKTAHLMEGKLINMVFDDELDKKIEAKQFLNYGEVK